MSNTEESRRNRRRGHDTQATGRCCGAVVKMPVEFCLQEEQLAKQRDEYKQNTTWEVKAHELEKENEKLKTQIINLQSEIYGSRLAAKYLDKELAGR